MALPNLIILGAMKCGTTSLHQYLDLHPDIAMARIKETDFFLDGATSSRGLAWYEEQFDGRAAIRGESSPNYTKLPDSSGAAERMLATLPRARLIYLVRDPISRITSHYVHLRAAGVERRSLEVALRDPTNPYVRVSEYATQLRPFIEAYSLSSILVESQERMLSRRREVLSRVFRFLGVDPFFDTPEFEREWEQTAGKGRIYKAAIRAAMRIEGRGLRLPPRIRWPVQRLVRMNPGRGSLSRPEVSPLLRMELSDRLKGEADALREMTGMELSEWSV